MNSNKSDAYYGGYFWLSLISFIVPLFVAYAAFSKITPTTKPVPNPDSSGVDHNLWDYLLRTYVESGLVDYSGISKDYLFKTYLQQLAAAQPDKLATREEKFALHCNAYNALVINGVVNHKIHLNEMNVLKFTPRPIVAQIDAINEEIDALKRQPKFDPAEAQPLLERVDRLRFNAQFFRLKEHVFANSTISLDHLEHEMIRPTFNDPRVHVALVCAAMSCPAIRGEAYVGARIDAQLEDQSVQFANNERYVRLDAAANTLHLSPILKWYAEDWDDSGGYLAWIAERVESPTLKAAVEKADEGSHGLRFNNYDWTLNAQADSGALGPPAGGNFGSGSVPNE